MRFHVHCVMEPNQIRRCLTVDSALDTHILEKKKYAATHRGSFVRFRRTHPSSFSLSSSFFCSRRKLPLSRQNSQRGLPTPSSKLNSSHETFQP